MRAELLTDPNMSMRGAAMMRALVNAAPIEIKVSTAYSGTCELLVTYGTGHPVRRPWWMKHRASGGRCIGWDLGYWRGDLGYMRATIDDDHPQRWIRPEPGDRWDAQQIELRNDFNPKGPAVIVGLGKKSLGVGRLKPMEWEKAALQRVRQLGIKPLFKPKKARMPVLAGVPVANGTIEQALKGAALVVCRHSNVAVDACIAGVPVICEDGAAHALYRDRFDPNPEQRLDFLRSLAWWQWKPDEAKDAWKYLLNRLSV